MSICPTFPCRRTAGGCPVCDPPNIHPMYQTLPVPTYIPPGCICPPTSEKTCESPTCPRKGTRITTSAPALSQPGGKEGG